MSIRNLESLFDPASVAVIGASARPGSIGATVWHRLRTGGYPGRLDAVNARHPDIDGVAAYASVAALPQAPELAVICTPPATVPGLIAALALRGTRAAVVLSAGLDAKQKQAMLAAARPGLLRLLGPDSLGLLAPHLGLDASHAAAGATPGSMAFVSQSGALMSTLLAWARDRGIGFSQLVSLGDQADIDFGDMLDFLASDPRTRAILLYIESARSARKFMSAARAAARNKPVIVVKTGRSAAGREAAIAHSGAMAGDDAAFDAAIRRAGMLRVDTLQDLFMAAETLSRYQAAPRGSAGGSGRDAALSRLTILTNGGGAGVLAADAAALAGVELAAPGPALEPGRPQGRSRGNPIDLGGEASVERHLQALRALLADPASGTLLFIHAPSAEVPSAELAAALLPLVAADPARLFCCWLGDAALSAARRSFHDAGVPSFDTPEEAVRAFSMLQTYRRNQELLLEAPPASACPLAPDIAAVRQIVAAALADRREALTDAEARTVLAACRIEHAAEAAPQPQDLFVGTGIDAVFGPTIAFGAGGTSAEAQADRALALPPLNAPLARELVSRTRVGRRLAGQATADPALPSLLTTLSQLLAEVPEIAELAIEPLRLAAQGAVAHGIRIRVSAAAPGGAGNFAIRPYPAQLSERIEWRGRTLTLRPVRPEDEAQHLAFLGRLDAEDLRMRIFYSRRTIERSELARLTQIDYEREMAFLATAIAADGGEETLAVARAVADPDNRDAEFGIIVRSDLKGSGLGRLLMVKLIAYLRDHGTQRLVATVLKENQGMLALARALGFVTDPAQSDGDTRAIHLELQNRPAR